MKTGVRRILFFLTLSSALPAASAEFHSPAFDALRGIQSGAFAPPAFHLVPAPKDAPAKPKRLTPQDIYPGMLTEPEMQVIKDMSALLADQYVDAVDPQKLRYGAIRGMANSLDPYSTFFDPEEAKKFKEEFLEGNLVGIGAVLLKKGQGEPLRLESVVPGSPAKKAGLKRGDEIVEVDGISVAAMDLEEVVKKIRGKDGTSVSLKIQRKGPKAKAAEVLSVTIKRALVDPPDVFSRMLPNGVGYVYFNRFRANTETEVVKQIRALRARGASSLILDLRNNPGGQVDVVEQLSADFLRLGQKVVSVKNRKGEEEPYMAFEDGEFCDIPLKVLVGRGSASASEIFAGAMQDNKRALIIGQRTYGKGLVQSVISLPDGSILKITVQYWYTPLGHSIQKDDLGHGGITPDIVTQVPLEVEIKALSQREIELNGEPEDPSIPDPTLDAALRN